MKESQSQLALPEEHHVSLAAPAPSIAGILQAAVAGGITSENVAVVERLMAMKERQDAAQARADFAAAFVNLQSELPSVKAAKPVPGKNGEVKYWYATFEGVMDTLSPLLTKYGFAVTFDTRVNPEPPARVTAVCTLMHKGGFERPAEFTCRIGSGPPNASDAQTDGAAVSYAKRFALCAAFNIVVEANYSTDARGEGAKITQAEADELRALAVETKSVEVTLLKWLNAETFEGIMQSRLADARRVLNERKKKLVSGPVIASDKDPEERW